MTPAPDPQLLRLAIPKGRMYDGVVRLLSDAGVGVRVASRGYRPAIAWPNCDVKILKPRAIIGMLDVGARDLGFAGADWVAEDNADLVELLDTGLDFVRLVAAAPDTMLVNGDLPARPLVVASEYVNLTRTWATDRGLDATLLRSFGATEVLPPEDADCIIDNTATGATLNANHLAIFDELMTSTTRLYASRAAMDRPDTRARIEDFTMLLDSVLEARRRVMVEINVAADRLADVVATLPCMRQPTISPMHGEGGYAVKAAILRSDLPTLIPAIRNAGGADIVVTTPEQIVP